MRSLGVDTLLSRNTRKTGRPAPLESDEFVLVWRRGKARPFALLTGLAVALLCTAVGYMATASAAGGHCKSTACTYFDANGQGRAGTCGAKKGDAKNCYCIVDDDKKLSQKQSGCSSTPEK